MALQWLYDDDLMMRMLRWRQHDNYGMTTLESLQLNDDDVMITVVWQHWNHGRTIKKNHTGVITTKERRQWNDHDGLTMTLDYNGMMTTTAWQWQYDNIGRQYWNDDNIIMTMEWQCQDDSGMVMLEWWQHDDNWMTILERWRLPKTMASRQQPDHECMITIKWRQHDYDCVMTVWRIHECDSVTTAAL